MKTIDLAILVSGIVMLYCAYEFHSAGMAAVAACAFVVCSFAKDEYSQIEKPLKGHVGSEENQK